MLLNNLTQAQLEAAFQLIESLEETIKIPKNLSHLSEQEWDMLGEYLADIRIEQMMSSEH
tara:strand:+ start:471 stop:650 length:180 start_codon:yes stop_codon:yes gene_type:complete